MNNRDPHIVNSLRRWLQGDVNQKEESQLEEEAREDLFLQEAIEGYRRFPEGLHQQRLDRVREKLQSSPRKRAGLLISFPYRIAAAAAVILAVGLFWFLNPGPSDELAEAVQTETDHEESKNPAAEGLESDTSIAANQVESADTQTFRIEPVNPPAPSPSYREEVPVSAPEPTIAEAREFITAETSDPAEKKLTEPASAYTAKEIAAAKSKADSAGNTESAPPEATRGMARSSSIAQPVSPAPPSSLGEGFPIGGVNLDRPSGTRLITGQVIDRSGAPLNGVLVVSPGDRTGTITNLNGQYQLLLDSNVQKLEFQRTGYNFQRVDVPESGGIVRVMLDETAPTVDRVRTWEVDAFTKRKKEKIKPSISGINTYGNIAEPMVGHKRFENYLSLNLRYPEQALANEITGEVVLSFTIMPDGQLTNVRAIQGPGYGLEQEAIRLLQGGAKWKITNGSTESISFTYRMKFTL